MKEARWRQHLRTILSRRSLPPAAAMVGAFLPGLVLFRNELNLALISPSGISVILLFELFPNTNTVALLTPAVLSVISISSVFGLIWLARKSPGWLSAEVIFFAINTLLLYLWVIGMRNA